MRYLLKNILLTLLPILLSSIVTSCMSGKEDPYLDLAVWQKNKKDDPSKIYKGVRYEHFVMDYTRRKFAWNVPRSAQVPRRAVWELGDPDDPEFSIVGIVMWDYTYGKFFTPELEKRAIDEEFKKSGRFIHILSYESRIVKKFGIDAVEYELTAITNPDKKASTIKPMKIYSRGYRFVWPKGSINRFCVEFTERGPKMSPLTRDYVEEFFRAIIFDPEK